MAKMKYFYELTISSSPHMHSPVTTQTIMRDVLIALLPAWIASIYFFGPRAFTVAVPLPPVTETSLKIWISKRSESSLG